MVGKLLLRGMLVGIVAGLFCFTFLKVFGEPPIERAIAFETQLDAAKAKAKQEADRAAGRPVVEEESYEIFSRSTQSGIGLFTGVMTYNTAFGGLFALAFALAYGRAGSLAPRPTAVLLAACGFVALYVVPNLKYPANPPSIGDPDTIGLRTALYFGMIAISLTAMIAANMLRRSLRERFGDWNACIGAGLFYLVAVVTAGLLLPTINEVPEAFPAVVLWQFRTASFGAQFVMWTVLALGFGFAAQRLLGFVPDRRPTTAIARA